MKKSASTGSLGVLNHHLVRVWSHKPNFLRLRVFCTPFQTAQVPKLYLFVSCEGATSIWFALSVTLDSTLVIFFMKKQLQNKNSSHWIFSSKFYLNNFFRSWSPIPNCPQFNIQMPCYKLIELWTFQLKRKSQLVIRCVAKRLQGAGRVVFPNLVRFRKKAFCLYISQEKHLFWESFFLEIILQDAGYINITCWTSTLVQLWTLYRQQTFLTHYNFVDLRKIVNRIASGFHDMRVPPLLHDFFIELIKLHAILKNVATPYEHQNRTQGLSSTSKKWSLSILNMACVLVK